MDCPWNSPGNNTGVGCHPLLQGIFLTQGSNPGLLHCRQTLYHPSHQGESIRILFKMTMLCLSTYLRHYEFLIGHNETESLIWGQQSFEVEAKIHTMRYRWSVRVDGSKACHVGMSGRAWVSDWL